MFCCLNLACSSCYINVIEISSESIDTETYDSHLDIYAMEHILHQWLFLGGIHWSLMDSPHKGPIVWKFHVFFVVSQNKLFNKQSSCQWLKVIFSCDAAVLPKIDSKVQKNIMMVCYLYNHNILIFLTGEYCARNRGLLTVRLGFSTLLFQECHEIASSILKTGINIINHHWCPHWNLSHRQAQIGKLRYHLSLVMTRNPLYDHAILVWHMFQRS